MTQENLHNVYARDLQQWFPALIRQWRLLQKQPGPLTHLTDKELKQIARHLQVLSHGLTRNRTLAGSDYFAKSDWLTTYLLYFWPVSYIQARSIIRSLRPKPKTVLELGSGAGPLGAACLDLGIRDVVMMDRNDKALHLSRQLTAERHYASRQIRWNPYAHESRIAGRFDLISIQHALNELWLRDNQRLKKIAGLIISLKNHLRPDGKIVLVEPALTETSRDLLVIRNTLLQEGFSVLAPCLHNQNCQALNKPTDSCHSDVPWNMPSLLKELTHLAGFKKKELKMTYLVITPKRGTVTGPPPGENHWLIVSEPMKSKNNKIRFIACGPLGRLGLSLKPDDVTADNKPFLTLRRGAVIRLIRPEATEQGYRITKHTGVTLIRQTP